MGRIGRVLAVLGGTGVVGVGIYAVAGTRELVLRTAWRNAGIVLYRARVSARTPVLECHGTAARTLQVCRCDGLGR